MTTPEVSHVSDDATEHVSPHRDIGYDIPFVPGEMTSAQAHQLHDNQHIGGREAARIALRPERFQQLTPEQLWHNISRSMDNNRLRIDELELLRKQASDAHEVVQAATFAAEKAKLVKKQQELSRRLGNITARIDPHEQE